MKNQLTVPIERVGTGCFRLVQDITHGILSVLNLWEFSNSWKIPISPDMNDDTLVECFISGSQLSSIRLDGSQMILPLHGKDLRIALAAFPFLESFRLSRLKTLNTLPVDMDSIFDRDILDQKVQLVGNCFSPHFRTIALNHRMGFEMMKVMKMGTLTVSDGTLMLELGPYQWIFRESIVGPYQLIFRESIEIGRWINSEWDVLESYSDNSPQVLVSAVCRLTWLAMKRALFSFEIEPDWWTLEFDEFQMKYGKFCGEKWEVL